MALGRQSRWDVRHCDSSILNREYELRELLINAVEMAGAKVLQAGGYAFEPREPGLPAGATCFVHATNHSYTTLAESHAWIHTYPEYQQYMVDVFTCGTTIDPDEAAKHIMNALGGERHRAEGSDRGFDPE